VSRIDVERGLGVADGSGAVTMGHGGMGEVAEDRARRWPALG
jgi:hypothetical protein